MGDAQAGAGQHYAGYSGGWQQQAHPPSFPRFNPGDPVSLPGYPDGLYYFGGWSGEHPYYIANGTGRSVWASELPPPIVRPDPKQIGAAIAAAATQRRYVEQQQWQAQYWGSYDPQYGAAQAWTPAYGTAEADTASGERKRAAEGDAGDENGTDAGTEASGEGGTAKKQKKGESEGTSTNGTVEDELKELDEGGDCGEGRVGTVLVWDLDETLIVFNSLLTGSFAGLKEMSGENAKSLATFAEHLETLVYKIAEGSLFFNSLEGRNYWNLWAATHGDDGRDLDGYDFDVDGLAGRHMSGDVVVEEEPADRQRSALRYRLVKQRFQRARENEEGFKQILDTSSREAAQAYMEAIDALTDKWLSTAEEVLSSIWQFDTVVDGMAQSKPPLRTQRQYEELRRRALAGEFKFTESPAAGSDSGGGGGGGRTHVNVLVTNGELVPTLAKLMLFGLHKSFHPSCIMSAREVGKTVCFAEIVRRFRGAEKVVAIGDSKEEESAATRCGFHFVKVSTPADIRLVQNFLQ